MIPAISMWSLEAVIKEMNWKQRDFIIWASENKVKHVELLSYYMNKENNANEVKLLLDDLKMTVSCYTILNDFSDPDNDGYEEFKADLAAAEILEAPAVRVLTGSNACLSNERRSMLIERLKQAASDAEKKGIMLILENIGPSSGHSAEAVSIIEEVNSDYLKINFDTANPLLADEDPVEALEKILPHLAYIHLKDFITEKSEEFTNYTQAEWRIQSSRKGLKMTGVTPGKGDVPLKKIFGILKNNGYKGFISVEYENDLEPEAAVLESIAYIASASGN